MGCCLRGRTESDMTDGNLAAAAAWPQKRVIAKGSVASGMKSWVTSLGSDPSSNRISNPRRQYHRITVEYQGCHLAPQGLSFLLSEREIIVPPLSSESL